MDNKKIILIFLFLMVSSSGCLPLTEAKPSVTPTQHISPITGPITPTNTPIQYTPPSTTPSPTQHIPTLAIPSDTPTQHVPTDTVQTDTSIQYISAVVITDTPIKYIPPITITPPPIQYIPLPIFPTPAQFISAIVIADTPTQYVPPIATPTRYIPPTVPPTLALTPYIPPIATPTQYIPPIVPPTLALTPYIPPTVTPTQYIPPIVPPTLALTPYIPPTVTPTQYIPPTAFTPTAQYIPRSDPNSFVKWYFTSIWQERNFEYLWTFLTPQFKSHSSPGGFKEYTNWWGNVSQVDILFVNVVENNGSYATVNTILAFYLNNGQTIPSAVYSYDLVYNSDRQTWMFDYR